MKTLHRTLALFLAVIGLSASAWAQTASRTARVNDRQIGILLRRIETRTETFRTNLDGALDRSSADGTRLEDEVNQYVRDFSEATNRLRDNFQERRNVSADVNEVLARANYINSFLRNNRLNVRSQNTWNMLRVDLNTLARYYRINWRWNDTANNGYPGNNGYPANNGDNWTGTYRLDTSRSDNIDRLADRETASLRPRDRQYVRDELVSRLATPEQLAISRRNYDVTIASTLAPQITLRADGRSTTERSPQGNNITINSRISGNQLIITTTGQAGNDFSATLTSTDNGRRLQVMRQIYVNELRKTVNVNSYYDRTSDIAQLDLYRGYPNNNNGNTGNNNNTGTYTTFVVPNNTQLVVTLNNALSTKTVQTGDRFTANVTAPNQYSGAVLEGYVANVERSGRLSGRAKMTLDFDRIRLRDGSTYRFAGTLESVRFTNGETVSLDTENVIREGDNQTTRTVTRTGIGTGIGAIIGAIAGGGKGAAIGAILGAGAGAGSVLAEGRDDLDLMTGTEMTIRASAPGNISSVR